MRIAALMAAVWAWTSAAAAQEPVEDGLGPYRFGMSVEAVQATSQTAAWRLETAEGRQTLTGARSAMIGGARFTNSLVFENGALARIELSAVAEHSCDDTIPNVVLDLEQSYGAFHSAPALAERGVLTQVRHTDLRSEVRFLYNHARQTASVHSTQRRERMMIAVSGAVDSPSACGVSISFDSRVPEVPEREHNLFRRIENAQTVSIIWARRPQPSDFARYYPSRAVDLRRDGFSLLDCLIMENGKLECRVAYEDPAEWGFGGAAMRLSDFFSVDVDRIGAAYVGKRVRIPIQFAMRR